MKTGYDVIIIFPASIYIFFLKLFCCLLGRNKDIHHTPIIYIMCIVVRDLSTEIENQQLAHQTENTFKYQSARHDSQTISSALGLCFLEWQPNVVNNKYVSCKQKFVAMPISSGWWCHHLWIYISSEIYIVMKNHYTYVLLQYFIYYVLYVCCKITLGYA